MVLRHVIKSQQFSREDLERIFALSYQMEEVAFKGWKKVLEDKTMLRLFTEPSTRTFISFGQAMRNLGGNVDGSEHASQSSSFAKGERLEDSIRTLAGYKGVSVIVLRHHQAGAAERAAAVSDVTIINAGDGAGQHPTQALLDLYTIKKELGGIDGITIAMVGDLAHGRTVRSLDYLLTKFDIKKIYFVAPDVVRMNNDIKDHLTGHGTPWEESENLQDVVRSANVVYATRIQRERFGDRASDYRSACGKFIIDRTVMERMRDDAIVMHPFPINRDGGSDEPDEITLEVDGDRRAAYFRQAHNGLYVRMAILKLVLAPDAL